jgi:hypothetical protein
MNQFGPDILKDENFYHDLPEVTTRRISKVFQNNTYLLDEKSHNNADQLLDAFSDEKNTTTLDSD